MNNIEKFQLEANIKGLTLISNSDKRSHYTYQFNDCKHTHEYSPSNVRHGKPICKTCQLEVFKNEANEKGLTLIGIGKKSKHYEYQFQSCKHKKEYTTTDIRIIKPVCNICQVAQFKKEASKQGIKLIGNSNKPSHYLYKFNSCGHKFEQKPSKVRFNKPTCEQCGNTHFNEKSYFYIINIFNKNESFLKIGIANDIKKRIKSYKLKDGYNAKLLKSFKFDSKYDAIRFEKKLERNIKQYKLSADTMKKIIQCGFTECYPKSIIKEINNFITI